MKERYYFPHDLHARNDEKIIGLLQKMNWEGYGLYWAIVEKIYEAEGEILKDYDRIAYDMRTQCERIKSVCEDFDLFYISEAGGIRSQSIDRRMSERKEKQNQASSAAKVRWNNADAMRTQCGTYADASKNDAKEKEKEKEKESKEKRQEIERTTPPQAAFILPDWIPVDLWTGFVEMRVKIRKPLTDHAKELSVKSLTALKESGEDVKAVIEQSIERSYAGFFPIKTNGGSNGFAKTDRIVGLAAPTPGKYSDGEEC